MLRIALPIQVYALTGSTLATGGVVAANVGASFLVGAVAGVYVDRWDRRRTLVAGNLALAVVVAPLALVTTADRVWIVYVVAFCQAVAVQFVSPAEAALLPRLVPQNLLPAANGLNALNNNLARLVGPVLGGFAAALGIGAVVGLDLVSFLLAAALIAAIGGAHRADRVEERHVIAELLDGLRLVRGTVVVAILVGLLFVTSIGEGVMGALFAPFVVDALEGGAKELGWTMTAQAVGGIAGGLFAGRWIARFGALRVVPVTLVLFGLIDLVIFNYPRWSTAIVPVLVLFVVVGVPGAVRIRRPAHRRAERGRERLPRSGVRRRRRAGVGGDAARRDGRRRAGRTGRDRQSADPPGARVCRRGVARSRAPPARDGSAGRRRRPRRGDTLTRHGRRRPTGPPTVAEATPRGSACRLPDGGGPVSSIPMRILIAEDETIIRLDLRELLEKSGFEVVAEARDGEEAVALARSEEPDLALLDVKMPKLDGIDAARRILDERPIPIVMVTAYGEQELVARAVEAGVFGYLVKPFRETDLLPAIETARARHDELVVVRAEADSLAAALSARKAIERAKGLLDGARGAERARRLRASPQGEPDLRTQARGRGRGADRDPRRRSGRHRRGSPSLLRLGAR